MSHNHPSVQTADAVCTVQPLAEATGWLFTCTSAERRVVLLDGAQLDYYLTWTDISIYVSTIARSNLTAARLPVSRQLPVSCCVHYLIYVTRR